MKRFFLLLGLVFCFNFFALSEVRADEGEPDFQIVQTDDGRQVAVPADLPYELLEWFLAIYDRIQEMLSINDKTISI